jgi:hypothetical protein
MAKNGLAGLSDDDLVAAHSVRGVDTYFISEMLRRHKDATDRIGTKLERLNILLLRFTVVIAFFTIVIAALTLVQFIDTLGHRTPVVAEKYSDPG